MDKVLIYNQFIMRNLNYQNTQIYFNFSLDFRIFTKDKPESEISDIMKGKIHKGFYVLKVPEDRATQEYFRVEL